MARDAQFWKTAGDTLGTVAAVLTPLVLAIAAAVKKYRTDHPEAARADAGKEAPAVLPASDPCGDLKDTVARLEHENARLEKAIESANDRADKADARAARLQEFLDARSGPKPPPETP